MAEYIAYYSLYNNAEARLEWPFAAANFCQAAKPWQIGRASLTDLTIIGRRLTK